MKIALSSEDNQGLDSLLSHHFGKCPYFVMVDVDEDGSVRSVENVANPYYEAHQPGVVPQFIKEQGADVIIAGGMGPRAVQWFQDLGIKAVITQGGRKIADVLDDYVKGKLKSTEGGSCRHY